MSADRRSVRWPADLPAVEPFSGEGTPLQVAMGLVGVLQRDGEELQWALEAGARLRCWWQSLDDQGQRLDPYPGLTGDQYIWSALRLVAAAAGRPGGDGVWNLLRRAEANVRAWVAELDGGAPPTVW